MDYNVYLLVNDIDNCTYIGCTNNLTRRLRQHNRELVGGARYTTNKKCKWSYYGYISNLDRHTALSIEKKIHIHSKKTKGITPLDRRLNCINNILSTYENNYVFVL